MLLILRLWSSFHALFLILLFSKVITMLTRGRKQKGMADRLAIVIRAGLEQGTLYYIFCPAD